MRRSKVLVFLKIWQSVHASRFWRNDTLTVTDIFFLSFSFSFCKSVSQFWWRNTLERKILQLKTSPNKVILFCCRLCFKSNKEKDIEVKKQTKNKQNQKAFFITRWKVGCASWLPSLLFPLEGIKADGQVSSCDRILFFLSNYLTFEVICHMRASCDLSSHKASTAADKSWQQREREKAAWNRPRLLLTDKHSEYSQNICSITDVICWK